MARPIDGYRLRDGTRVPGTTTILGRYKESGALLRWAFQRGKAGVPELYDETQTAADIGTYVHELAEWHIEDKDDQPEPAPPKGLSPESISRGRLGYENFLQWKRQSNLYVVSWEKPLVSECHKYGGTPDGLFEQDGCIDLGDWKSSKRVYAEYLLQMAAYIILIEECCPNIKIRGVHIVRFSKDFGDFEHRFFTDLELEKKQFLLLREAYGNDQILKRRF